MDAFIFGGKSLFEWALSLFRMTIDHRLDIVRFCWRQGLIK